ncbi:MAG: HEPN domain-containing protein [Deltaproteobacteria bacterium]|nr:HEPN domain-containing protein [Deltaproteobacteria bacterium]
MRPPEEVKRELVRQWLGKAEQDLKAAEALLSGDPPLLYPSCFHSQQAAEKYIKAYLTWHQVEFPKTHDFDDLLELMGRVDKPLAGRLGDTPLLTPYGVEVRYPDDVPEATLTEAEEALELAKKVRDTILPLLERKPDS